MTMMPGEHIFNYENKIRKCEGILVRRIVRRVRYEAEADGRHTRVGQVQGQAGYSVTASH